MKKIILSIVIAVVGFSVFAAPVDVLQECFYKYLEEVGDEVLVDTTGDSGKRWIDTKLSTVAVFTKDTALFYWKDEDGEKHFLAYGMSPKAFLKVLEESWNISADIHYDASQAECYKAYISASQESKYLRMLFMFSTGYYVTSFDYHYSIEFLERYF